MMFMFMAFHGELSLFHGFFHVFYQDLVHPTGPTRHGRQATVPAAVSARSCWAWPTSATRPGHAARRWRASWRSRLATWRFPIWDIYIYGYGSIPINTIFRGMNIHLPAILMFTRGTRFWHTAIWDIYIWYTLWLWLTVRHGKIHPCY